MVTMVETSNVGVKVGMVGRGVMDVVGVLVGVFVVVWVGGRNKVGVSKGTTGVTVATGDSPAVTWLHAVRRNKTAVES
jgi:hypothetical protein